MICACFEFALSGAHALRAHAHPARLRRRLVASKPVPVSMANSLGDHSSGNGSAVGRLCK